ncbi:hypothetical protein PR202_ga12592 [Eleusine coracana subsp. coracana]|uniref:Endonuclease/exonuclease/phosphatase domain-containing protein n=1 Tax=Eleusine coracana subsp. coracana TaxID=191504 RepID=A0AAV5CCJ6_ELECO|nr:hypothetical protein PR202_ga12592 [Eleusine coracana subsp. coracana]
MTSALRFLILDDADDPLDFGATAGAAFLPLRRCAEKRKRAATLEVVEVCAAPPEIVEVRSDGGGSVEEEAEVIMRPAKKGSSNSHDGKKSVKIIGNSDIHMDKKAVKIIGDSNTHLGKKTVKIMTYNVWFREEVQLKRRMNALGNLIQHHSPDLICFQMSKLPVKSFDRIPFTNSHMRRELCIADVNVGDTIKLMLATSHLESPCPSPPTWDQMFSKERVAQANESLSHLGGFHNVIFCGDMNWDDKGDGPFPLPDGWIDAWAELKPGENGWTFDTKANVMLTGYRKLQKRLDRFVCKLSDFKVDSIEMIGKEPIPGVTYTKEKKVRNEIHQLQLPVFPSDHFGLVLTITYRPESI